MFLLLLAACHGPGETGDGGMVGHILDADGQPVAGVRVQSVEAEVRTDEAGHFAVQWKPPDTHMFFVHQGLTWTRALQPDDPAQVTIQLPELLEVQLRCSDRDTTSKLTWELGPGYAASVLQRCQPGKTVVLPTVPPGVPTVETRIDGKVVEMDVIEVDGDLAFAAPERPVRIDVQSTEGAAPAGCTVTIDGAAASTAGEGFWTGRARGAALVEVSCEGRAAWPTRVAADSGSHAVDWSRTGPTLDLEGSIPEAAQLRIAPSDSTDWLVVSPDDNGVFHLPPIPAGEYRARIAVPDTPAAPDPKWPTEGKEGSLWVVERPDEVLGVLDLPQDLTAGRLPVDRAGAP